MADQMMSNSVKAVLQESFLAYKDGDIHMKASQMMAINLLEEGFEKLKKYSNQTIKQEKDKVQVGL